MSILRSSSIYLISSLISKAVPFILLPFLTNTLSKYEFGILSLFLVINTLFVALIGMGMHINVTKYIHSISKSQMAVINGNLIMLLTVNAIISLLILFVVDLFVNEIFSIPVLYMYIFPMLATFAVVNNIFLSVLRNQQKALMYSVYELLMAAIVLFGTIILLINTDLSWRAQVVSMLVASFVVTILGIKYLHKHHLLCFKPAKRIQKKLLRISLPLIPHAIGGIVIAVSDRLFIERMEGVEAVALYSIGYSFGAVLSLFTDAFVKAWNPWFFKVLVKPDRQTNHEIVKYTYQYIVSVFILAIVLSAISIFILPYLVQSEFDGAKEYIIWVALGYAFHGVYKIFFPYLVHINRTSFLAFSTTLSAIVNLIFNYFLIGEYGAIGAAYSTILAYALSSVLVFIYQNKHYPMPWLSRHE